MKRPPQRGWHDGNAKNQRTPSGRLPILAVLQGCQARALDTGELLELAEAQVHHSIEADDEPPSGLAARIYAGFDRLDGGDRNAAGSGEGIPPQIGRSRLP